MLQRGYARFGSSLRLKRCQGKGASLMLSSPAYREDAIDLGRLGAYLRDHYDSWYDFAVAQGRTVPQSGLFFVTGCDKTSDWACAAWSDSTADAELTFSTSVFGFLAGFSIWGRWKSNESLDTNAGPQRLTPEPSRSIASFLVEVLTMVPAFVYNFIWSSSSQDPSSPPDFSNDSRFNQCVFHRSYCMGDRTSFFEPKKFVKTNQGVTVVTKSFPSLKKAIGSKIAGGSKSGSGGSSTQTRAGALGTSTQTTRVDKASHEPGIVESSDEDDLILDVYDIHVS